VALKNLTDSQNITQEFLVEIANMKLVDGGDVIKCYGISRDPVSKNYVIVMEYMPDGNLRQYLQNKTSKQDIVRDKPILSLKIKLGKLKEIAKGLSHIHNQNLIHRDFHSGNILNNKYSSYITDLGLSRPVNHQRKDQIFGVLPYVAPEVLQGQTYTPASDIYSFGIIAYELLANIYPYPKMDDMDLALKVCRGYRPDIDKAPIPQLLKDLIKKC
jgi:serine/threonine protein kinase